MNPISIALGSRMAEAMNQVMMESHLKMNNLADKMLKTGVEVKLAGKEMGKGGLLDLVA
jgi:hypothetical protein